VKKKDNEYSEVKFYCPKCGGEYYSSYETKGGMEGNCNGGPNQFGYGGCGFTWLRTDDYKYFRKHTVKVETFDNNKELWDRE
jgi:hypothetical protein